MNGIATHTVPASDAPSARQVPTLTHVAADESGQAMSEYVFLVVLVALVLIPFFKILPEAIRGYVLPFYYCISRPFP